MNESLVDIPGNSQPAPRVERAALRESRKPNRFPRYVLLVTSLAVLSTFLGYQAARFEIPAASWFHHTPALASAFTRPPALVPASEPRAADADVEAISHLAPQQQAERLLKQIHNDPDSRYLALWRLGALGNRGVEPATVLNTLLRYSRDSNLQTRFWAVEGLAMLGTAESIDPLLSILAHDPAKQVRERAATNLARSGMFTGEQRLTAVPQLLNLLDDDSLDA